MEVTQSDNTQTEKPIKSKASKKQMILKKIDHEGAKLLSKLSERANKKTYGRRVKDKEIITLALGLVTDEHIKLLQEQTLNQMDRLKLSFDQHVKTNGSVTFDEYIGILLRRDSKNENPNV